MVAAVALTLGTGVANAEPVDLRTDYLTVEVGGTVWTPSIYGGDAFEIEEAIVYANGSEDLSGGQNGDAFDGVLALYVDDEAYGSDCAGGGDGGDGEPCTYVVDVTDDGDDVVVTAPTQAMSGLDVTVQHRYFAAGDLARVLAAFRNPGSAPITVEVTVANNYGSDSGTVVEADSSGDDAVTAADRWIVTGDGGSYDPVVTTHFFGAGAALAPTHTTLALGNENGGDGDATFTLTVAPGATAYLAFFVGVTGYAGSMYDYPDMDSIAAAPFLETYEAAVDAAVAAATAGLGSRLYAGVPAGASLLNWAPTGAPPATPATGTPRFTG
ncbi:hypothetical protein N867_05420 [Actinotalea fermentans ATCC 43279 = JCM 9966 = DSM 3133]|nr:hypothetical protein N867_05420 [Actinotalea fermentans ATCC 43279 = JCM 9966 = DSM 3133]